MGYFDNKEEFKVVPFTEILASQLNDLIEQLYNSFGSVEGDALGAKEWAIGEQVSPGVFDEDTLVNGEDFCSKKYASNASASASAAATSETNAGLSEDTALAAQLAAEAAANASAYDSGTTYNFPDAAIGSDGYTYRCIGTGVLGDDPVGSTTGNWVQLNGLSAGSNLLINSDFEVNQEVYTSGVITTGSYGHDMWKSISSASYTVSGGALTMVSGTLGQRNDDLIAASGETVTFSVESGSLVLGATAGVTGTVAERTVTPGDPFTWTLDMSSSAFVTITSATSAKGLKIERGYAATKYIKPEPTAEKLRCYSYYWKVLGAIYPGFDPWNPHEIPLGHGNGRYVLINTPTQMRGFPTVTINNATLITATSSSTVTDGTQEIHRVLGNGIVITANASPEPTGISTLVLEPADDGLVANQGYMAIDARY